MSLVTLDANKLRAVTEGVAVDARFPGRWSPRAMSGAAVSQAQLDSLLEAARWAPSCFNAQPWRFAVVQRDSDAWETLFATLAPPNQAWVAKAGAIIAVASRTRYEHNDKAAPTHSFDAGAAWMSLALQAAELGLVAHGMQGFDQTAARAALQLPDLYELPCLIALGQPGAIDELPDGFAEKEQPSPRKALAEIAFTDSFAGVDV
ncbi:MAG: nitroreductase family protein [Pseudomonadota bacterium]